MSPNTGPAWVYARRPATAPAPTDAPLRRPSLGATHNLLVPDILLLLPSPALAIIETNQIKMENIGSGQQHSVDPGVTGQTLHHSNYNCDITNLGQANAQLRHHHLSLHDREKNFSVTHLLELPGQGHVGHLYQQHQSPGSDVSSSDLQRVSQAVGLEHHQRMSNHQLKLQDGEY